MRSPLSKNLFIATLLAWALFQDVQVFSQAQKQEDSGTIKLRIEKQKDGKTEIIEKTYKADEWPGSIDDTTGFNFSDSFKNFGDRFQMQFDTIFSGFEMPDVPAMSFYFNNADSVFLRNELFLKKGMDSLSKKHEQMVFQFNHEFKPSLDSILTNLNNRQPEFKFYFENNLNTLDSLLNHSMDGMKNFQFNWSDDDFNNKNMNLLLDKDDYLVEETEDAHGNKMIRIRPKSEKREDKIRPRKIP